MDIILGLIYKNPLFYFVYEQLQPCLIWAMIFVLNILLSKLIKSQWTNSNLNFFIFIY